MYIASALASLAVLLLGAQADPVGSVQALVARLLGPQYANAFDFKVINSDPTSGNDVFELDSGGNRPVIRGNTGVALASGLNWYLKYHCNASVSWGRNGSGNNVGNLPSPLPLPGVKVRQVSPVKHRYMYNVCTYGYSLPWWNATQWQAEVDRLAMWGINLPLAFIGTEYITQQFLVGLGLTTDQVEAWIAGPAFLPWFRMNNMYHWGGPPGQHWIQAQHDLQLQVLVMMREYGMTPVLPGFAGHFPQSILTVMPNLNLTQNTGWVDFNTTYSSSFLLEPSDPMFIPLGANYTKLILAEYGSPGEIPYFSIDTYNEMEPSSGDPTFLAASNKAVYDAMAAGDPNAVYVMMSWLFLDPFWTPTRVEAYLSTVPNDRMLILDLNSEQRPLWQMFDSYYGKPFVWDLLLIFGGRRGLYGNLTQIATDPLQTLKQGNTTMSGIGATPEAIEGLPIMFDLFFEIGWRSEYFDVDEWVQQYAVRRYGRYSPSISKAMAILRYAAYNATFDESQLELSPGVDTTSTRNTNATGILQAWRLFVQAGQKGEVDSSLGPYQYDLTDLTRQALMNIWDDYHQLQGLAYEDWPTYGINSSARVIPLTNAMTTLIHDMDKVLGANENFLLGNWIGDALSWADGATDPSMLQLNARNLITLWGPANADGSNQINDYAPKQWSGMVGGYYAARWKLLTDWMVAAVVQGFHVNYTLYNDQLLDLEHAFTYNTSMYPSTPVGDPLQLAVSMLDKYANTTSRYIVHEGTDTIGVGNDTMLAWITDYQVLAQLCDTDPGCAGFNSNGWLKVNVTQRVAANGVTLYVKP